MRQREEREKRGTLQERREGREQGEKGMESEGVRKEENGVVMQRQGEIVGGRESAEQVRKTERRAKRGMGRGGAERVVASAIDGAIISPYCDVIFAIWWL